MLEYTVHCNLLIEYAVMACSLFKSDQAASHKGNWIYVQNKFKLLTWPPNPQDHNPIKHLLDVQDKHV